MNNLIEFLHSIYPLSAELKIHLQKILKKNELPKRSFLLKKGHVCKSICFIESGLVRCYYEKNDKEICSWFMKEGDIIISVESFFNQAVSNESIQALEDCILYCIEYSELQYIYRHFPEFNFVGRLLTEKYYALSEQRLYSIRMQRGRERYEYLINYFPELIKRVPSKFIASYLGITEVSLSRIRSLK